ncbi:hypothetical protein JOB18_026160 [Solea senegalensis]|uniref:Uncharacterized protein n=1 Tax=Solea senegalensis TaxID=28829 RepID=A0AAV6PZK6_SOLSE|nr:hypothetical protein JOB18_026160 [Solea senegalensis]
MLTGWNPVLSQTDNGLMVLAFVQCPESDGRRDRLDQHGGKRETASIHRCHTLRDKRRLYWCTSRVLVGTVVID